ncbi:MAG: phosphoribosylamine--glycine ligase [Chloroflexaceae bacterium]|nr:phosphoribosylamine--glycine ligase [Chloroflexaceae bacterium]
MKALIVGNGGREHALAWKFQQSPQVNQVICVPGNGGTAMLPNCINIPLPVDDLEGIARAALVNGVGLVVVGPELPLALGITDYLQGQGLKVFGPSKVGAQIEASKAWAKALMAEAGVPTAAWAVFSDRVAAKAYIAQQGAPLVVKADGLAAGKGVIVCGSEAEAEQAVDSLFQQGFSTIVIEEQLAGEEVSVLAIADGKTLRMLLPAQDHKRIGEGDTGANTGGMGAYAPAPVLTPALSEQVERNILQPTLRALQQRGIDYRGVLYAGLMIAPGGKPSVLEFNCRFGDPETQVLLPLLESSLADILSACVDGRLDQLPPLQWRSGSAVCVVASAEGYPGSYSKGMAIAGIESAQAQDVLVFQAGTKLQQQQLIVTGGRVLGVTAVSSDFDSAIAKAYRGLESIQFPGIYYRRDIGYRVRHHNSEASP